MTDSEFVLSTDYIDGLVEHGPIVALSVMDEALSARTKMTETAMQEGSLVALTSLECSGLIYVLNIYIEKVNNLVGEEWNPFKDIARKQLDDALAKILADGLGEK